MRKITLLSSALIFIASQGFSQYFTVKIGGGYGWPGIQNSGSVMTFQPGTQTPDPATSTILPLIAQRTDSSSSKFKSNVYDGYGHGGHLDFSFGYMINPYFGVQLDGAYLWGRNVTSVQLYNDPLLGNNAKLTTSTHSNGLSVNPTFYFRAAKPTAKVAPYARIGLALPISGAIYHSLHIDAPGFAGGSTADINVKTEAAISLGFQGSVGVSYTPVPLITIWGEVSGQYLMVRAKESTLTKYDLNGQDFTKNFTTYSLVTNFVDKIDNNSNTTELGTKTRDQTSTTLSKTDESKPRDVLRQVANLSAFGFSVGITFNMSKKIFLDPFGKKAKAAAK
ncbi:MAG: hypothetical protein JWO03_3743 [Bacteroidetes bacterium]|nr:hypothetical protein [Bacteroidota bacterium]